MKKAETNQYVPDDFSVGFGDYITYLRNEQGRTMEDIAISTNFSLSYLQNVEAGKQIPTEEELEHLATPLGTTYQNLLFQAGYVEVNELFALLHAE